MISTANKKIAWLTGIVLVTFLITGIFYILFAKTVFIPESGTVNTIMITSSSEKNKASWGRELRIKHLLVGDSALELSRIPLSEGWSFDGKLLAFSGEGKPLVIPMEKGAGNIKIRYLTQEGSGIMNVFLDGKWVLSEDCYSEIWQENDINVRIASKLNRILFILSTFIFIGALLGFSFGKAIIFGKQPFGSNSEQAFSYPSTLGMFDSAKGLAMLGIVLFHSFSLYNYDAVVGHTFGQGYLLPLPLTIINNGLMPFFFIIYGYSQKRKAFGYQLRKLISVLLKPFLAVLILAVICRGFFAYLRNENVIKTIKDNLTGFVLDTNALGPLWFLLALFVGSVILNALLHIKNKTWQYASIGFLFIISNLLLINDPLPRIFYLSLSAVTYLYFGFILKEFRWFSKVGVLKRTGIVSLFVAIAGMALVNDLLYDHFSEPSLYIVIRELVKISAGFILFYVSFLFTRLSHWTFMMEPVKWIGRYSLWFLLIHSLDYLLIDWGGILENLQASTSIKILIIYLSRLALIILVVIVLIACKKHRRQLSVIAENKKVDL